MMKAVKCCLRHSVLLLTKEKNPDIKQNYQHNKTFEIFSKNYKINVQKILDINIELLTFFKDPREYKCKDIGDSFGIGQKKYLNTGISQLLR